MKGARRLVSIRMIITIASYMGKVGGRNSGKIMVLHQIRQCFPPTKVYLCVVHIMGTLSIGYYPPSLLPVALELIHCISNPFGTKTCSGN